MCTCKVFVTGGEYVLLQAYKCGMSYVELKLKLFQLICPTPEQVGPLTQQGRRTSIQHTCEGLTTESAPCVSEYTYVDCWYYPEVTVVGMQNEVTAFAKLPHVPYWHGDTHMQDNFSLRIKHGRFCHANHCINSIPYC